MSDGSIDCESSLRLRSTASVVESLVPSTESSPSRDVPVTDGLPAWQLALASAVTPFSASSGPEGAISAASAGRMSTLPIPGTASTPPPGSADRSSAGRAGSGSATDSSPRPAEAPATWESGSAPVKVVRAKSAPPATASGVAGSAPPASCGAHAAAPRLAVIGSTGGAVATVARSALASHWKAAASAAGDAASSTSMDVPMASGRERCMAALVPGVRELARRFLAR